MSVTFETVRELALALPEWRRERPEILMQADPETFFLTDHYVGWPAILVRLSRVDRDDLARLLEDSWQNAPKRLRGRFP